MASPGVPSLTKETVQRLAREQAGLIIPESTLEDFTKTVNALQAEAHSSYSATQRADEPAVMFALEEWTND